MFYSFDFKITTNILSKLIKVMLLTYFLIKYICYVAIAYRLLHHPVYHEFEVLSTKHTKYECLELVLVVHHCVDL